MSATRRIVAASLLAVGPVAAHPLDPALSRAARQVQHRPATLSPTLSLEPAAGVLRLQVDDPLALDPDGWADPERFTADLIAVGRATHLALPEREIDVVVLLTESPTPRGPAYLPLANDVRGLGYGHLGLAPDEIFRTGAAPWIDGVIHLGQLAVYTGPEGEAEARYQFLHELGHRWGAYARFMPPEGPPSDAWLGRDCAHWSFFTHSSGSALEGNRWLEAGPVWQAAPQRAWGYSDFDRYLMGFAPAERVAPTFFLPGGWDCDQPRRNGEANPSWQPPVGRDDGETQTAAGPAQRVTIEQLQAAEGPRVPAWPDTQQTWSVVFVLLTSSAEPPLAEADALRRMLTAAWMAEAQHPGLPSPLLISHADGRVDVPPPELEPDMGLADADVPDAEVLDAGLPDVGLPDVGPRDLGPHWVVDAAPDAAPRTTPRGSSGCATAPPAGHLGWLLLLALGLRPQRQRAGRARRSSN